MKRRETTTAMKVVPRFCYNPEKADLGLKAMAEILATAINRNRRYPAPPAEPTAP